MPTPLLIAAAQYRPGLLELRNLPAKRATGQLEDDERHKDQNTKAGPEGREGLAGGQLATRREPVDADGDQDGDQKCIACRGKAFGRNWRRKIEAGDVDPDDIGNDLDLAALVRHRAKHGEIPEEQLQQERHITDDFNIAGGKDAQHENSATAA